MEKTNDRYLKVSLENAQKLYTMIKPSIENNTSFVDLKNSILMESLLATFTKDELEGKKGFTWEDSFDGTGWFIDKSSVCTMGGNVPVHEYNKENFKTKEQAESALAFAQLSFIVAKYNEGKTQEGEYTYSIAYLVYHKRLSVDKKLRDAYNLEFYDEKDAEISLEVNRELWYKYWMVKK